MSDNRTYRPRVSRETRMLLITVCAAIAVLWMLARVRFPDRPVIQNPVQPLLTQIAPVVTLEALATQVAEAQPRIDPFVVPLHAPAVRLRDDLAVVTTLVPDRVVSGPPAELVTYDVNAGIAVVHVPSSATSTPEAWTPDRPQRARYLLATDVSPAGVYLRPVYIAGFRAGAAPPWRGELWLLPPRTDAWPGSFLFTTDGRLAGLVIDLDGQLAIVPTAVLFAEAERLLTEGTNGLTHIMREGLR